MSRVSKEAIDAAHLSEQIQIDGSRHYLAEIYQPYRRQLMAKIGKDIEVAHRRRWPGRSMNLASRLWLVLSSPGLRLLLMHRINNGLNSKRNNDKRGWFERLRSILFALPNSLLKSAIKINTMSFIQHDSEVEGGVSFSDQGHIIFGALQTGEGTVIGTRVTVGMSLVIGGRPKIGRNVWIGSDCVIYGAIDIGDGATLLPGTVLTKSVPAGVVMQGNPARMVLRHFDNSMLREHRQVDPMQYVKTTGG
ncbi:MAG: DapH/DapD/GlmU-related protein [Methylococcaceae bacterium]